MMKPSPCNRHMLLKTQGQHSLRGFTLIETAVVLVIIGLLVGGLLPALTTQAENSRRSQVKVQLEEIKQALIGYAQANNGRLPCPDCRVGGSGCTAAMRNNGQEDFNGANCRVLVGNLPWNTLGLSQGLDDPWGTRFGYYLDGAYDGNPVATLATTGSGTVSDSITGAALTSTAIAVVFSYGRNQAGGTSSTEPPGSAAVLIGSPVAGNDENNNNSGNNTFVSGVDTDAASTNGHFDDILIWLSPNEYNYHMVQAGILP